MNNVATIVGNLGVDPEMRITPKGNEVTTFSIGCYAGKRDDESQTQWIKVTTLGKLAKSANETLSKGDRVEVSGNSPIVRIWRDKEGQPLVQENTGEPMYSLEMLANKVAKIEKTRQDTVVTIK